ncbi:T-cell surface glycoprotein CD8 beta chain-like isoform X2 [Seriola aureovittata]|uniref:T-cell surface glycoprotein CD8 beta chain-like isoform X2 n=1 Tax=Seriola aureovittata TaxID=2871759 RepID=UPI0024BD7B83|nr:T-cell surface glycoprotein CD8 beta chain-like isoform X2 [Seriola aureovittata]
MKSDWLMAILVGIITMAEFVTAVEVQHVQFGSTVTLSCGVSYLYDTTWLKQNTDHTPTVVLCGVLREGEPAQVMVRNRSLILKITDVEETDLGLYYCIANENSRLKVGKGTMLKASEPIQSSGTKERKEEKTPTASPPGSPLFLVYPWYCAAMCLGLLIMVLTVCIIHWATNKTSRANSTQKDQAH